ncbi:Mannan endo-1,4-beta-mannosidase 1 [Coccomyxa sp. Obi]|nr:Mannan endo-1,4-beta-mannosidase 1 [Coccomyxa sp. Obi]
MAGGFITSTCHSFTTPESTKPTASLTQDFAASPNYSIASPGPSTAASGYSFAAPGRVAAAPSCFFAAPGRFAAAPCCFAAAPGGFFTAPGRAKIAATRFCTSEGISGGFISVQGGTFVDQDCSEFLAMGWNSWRLIEAAQGIQNALPNDQSVLNGENEATWLAQQAKSFGFNIMRLFGLADVNYNEGSPLQSSPGQYNEQVFKSVDFILDQMSQNGIRVIVALIDYWKDTDGVQQYATWCAGGDKDSFYTNSYCQQLYKNHISTMVNRRNTYNGRIYKDDPTIFAWDILNEPRQTQGDYSTVQTWINNFASYVKSVDPNHMVTVGEEGFFGPNDPNVKCNPGYSSGASWPAYSGQDFTNNHRSKDIDFTAVHAWPDNWQVSGSDFMTSWVNCHVDASASIGKPMLLEEFGKVVSQDGSYQRMNERTPYYTAALDAVKASISAGKACKGALFWEWTVRNPWVLRTMAESVLFCLYKSEGIDVSLPNGLHPYGVSLWDETFQGPVKDMTQFIDGHKGNKIAQCSQGGAVTAFG